jgi:hypothetical protein
MVQPVRIKTAKAHPTRPNARMVDLHPVSGAVGHMPVVTWASAKTVRFDTETHIKIRTGSGIFPSHSDEFLAPEQVERPDRLLKLYLSLAKSQFGVEVQTADLIRLDAQTPA